MTTDGNIGTIRPVKIEEEMRTSYLDYAMSVIVSRALPDVRDGLKPVQRRILYALDQLGLRSTARYKKSAGIVGEVLKSFHPHGDSPVYEAMVRMAQPFSLRYPLIDGQGNFGSVDNDPPAAMRYTEARLSPIAEELLADIDRDTVEFVPNYDDSLREPMPLPARLPNLLVNGASGIAVGMATNIPPHNLNEICNAITRLIDDPEATTEDLAEIVKGPDFPTGGIIYRMRREHEYDAEGNRKEVLRDAVKQTYGDGRGRIVVQARTHIEEAARGNRMQIIVTELPFQVNKAALVERIAHLVRDKRIDGISDLRDESDRHGMRIVIELSRTGQARQVLNSLFKRTPMQTTFPVNMLALVDGQPRVINLKTALEQYIRFRREVVRRRAEFDLRKAQEREHILQGLLIALSQLDQVIQTIRGAQSAEQAKERLMATPFGLSDRQAQAVLDMQLRRLARLESQKIEEEHKEISTLIKELEDLLASPQKIDLNIKDDVRELIEKYGDERRTQIVAQEAEQFTDEDLVAHQEVVVTISSRGYIKRLPLETYRPQGRGGRGITGMKTREADAVHRLIVADTHDSLLFFTDRGRVFQLRAFDVPDVSRQARGIPLINLIEIDQREQVTAVVAARDFDKDAMVLATAIGEVKKTPLSEFSSVRRAGLIAMDLEPEDVLVSAKLAHETDHVILVTSDGQSVRFPVAELRSASRASGGVRGLRLAKDARLVSLEVVSAGDQLFTLTRNGFGKRTPQEEYPIHHRGGAGVITFKVLDKTGPVATARMVKDSQELIVISQDGIVLRTRMDGISIQGRSTQGVAVIGLSPGDAVASVAVIEMAQEQGEASADGPEPAESPGEQQRLAEANEPAPEAQAPKKTSGKATDTPKQPKAGSSARADAALGKADTAMKKAKAAETKAKAGANKQDARTQRNGSSGRQKRTRGR
ncbi:MAG: DNA gyrase subunit A [Chloroflexi bacterium]|nr:DNA gyrase subunit A [Chloroflexota bacterium]